jgi:hypothetical protein
MKCPIDKCDGKFWVVHSYNIRGKTPKRLHRCDRCGYEDYTIEISSRDYERMRKLVVQLKVIVKDYMQN